MCKGMSFAKYNNLNIIGTVYSKGSVEHKSLGHYLHYLSEPLNMKITPHSNKIKNHGIKTNNVTY